MILEGFLSLKFIGAVEFTVADAVVEPAGWYEDVLPAACLVSQLLCAIELSVRAGVCEGFVGTVFAVAIVIVQSLPGNLLRAIETLELLIDEDSRVTVNVADANSFHKLALRVGLEHPLWRGLYMMTCVVLGDKHFCRAGELIHEVKLVSKKQDGAQQQEDEKHEQLLLIERLGDQCFFGYPYFAHDSLQS